MAIAGFETPSQVRAVLEGLAHERRSHIRDARHLAEIEKQEALFRAELQRMEEEGTPEEEATTNPALGTLSYVGIPGVDRGRIV